MNLEYTEIYSKQEKLFLKKHPNLKDRYVKTLNLLIENHRHPSLRLHKIYQKSQKEIFSISINIKYRILITILIQDQVIILLNIGDHKQVY